MAPLQVIIGKVRLWDYCSDYPERWLVYSVKKRKRKKSVITLYLRVLPNSYGVTNGGAVTELNRRVGLSNFVS